MTRNRGGNAKRDNPAPRKHQANVLSETLELEENTRIRYSCAYQQDRTPLDDSSSLQSMNVDVSTSIVIDRPRELVSGYAINPDHAPEWYVNIKAVEWKTPPPVKVGSHIAFVARFLGRRMAYTYEVIELVPGERLTMRAAEGPFAMETSYTWETTSNGSTQMTLRNRGTPAGFYKWLAPFIAGAMRRANRKDLAALKRRLESR